MALDVAIPTIVSARLIRNLLDESVWLQHVNRAWEPELRMYGDKVDILQIDPAAVTVNDYTPLTAITYGDPTFKPKITLELDNTKAWALRLDDVNRQEIKPMLLDQSAGIAQTKLRLLIDTAVRNEFLASAPNYNVNGGAAIALDVDAADPKRLLEPLLAAANRHFDVKNIPRRGRWMIVGPYAGEYIAAAYSGTGSGTDEATARRTLMSGYLTTVAGVDIIVDTRDTATGTTTKTEVAVVSSDYSVGFAQAISKVERLRLESYFADGIRGLYHWGQQKVEADSAIKATFKITPAINFA